MLRRLALILLLLACCVGSSIAQEKLVLTSAVAQPSITDYSVDVIRLARSEGSVLVELKPNASAATAPSVRCVWDANRLRCSNGYVNASAPLGATLLSQFNVTDFRTTSVEKATMNRLITDGAFAGSVTGTPQ